jgi:hypothetical protein
MWTPFAQTDQLKALPVSDQLKALPEADPLKTLLVPIKVPLKPADMAPAAGEEIQVVLSCIQSVYQTHNHNLNLNLNLDMKSRRKRPSIRRHRWYTRSIPGNKCVFKTWVASATSATTSIPQYPASHLLRSLS